SYAGRLIAEKLGYTFLDLDEQIEENVGMKIKDIFSRFGEQYFREKEREALHLTGVRQHCVISCGGGAPCFFDNADWMNAHGLSVFLDIPTAELVRRLEGGPELRPLLREIGPEGLEPFVRERLAQRRPFYSKSAVCCESSGPEPVIQAIGTWCASMAGFAGIDYGSKLAGTTVIAFYSVRDGHIAFHKTTKGQDADAFVIGNFGQHPWKTAFLDAPLSLPGVYFEPSRGGDFFYREADRATSAMSPMFLGGLTARAMRLASDLGRKGIATREVYPGKLAERARLNALGYKTKMVPPAHLAAAVQELFPFPVHWAAVDNWHTFDALLAYISGWRYTQGKHEAFGDPREGQIII
ncbi:MAG: hypothetical protein RL386_2041, partial [Bacteroidota bacterium]